MEVTDLQVISRDAATGIETELSYPTDYSVTGVKSRNGGTITLAQPLLSGELLSIRRSRPILQLTDLRNQGATRPRRTRMPSTT
jgi:hypothetical protein